MKIPDRWEIYQPLGTVVEGTRFLPFKVPLQQSHSGYFPADVAPFSPDDLVNITNEQGNNLGLVIDLTNTKKYYRKENIERHNIRYEKIFTEGHVVPSLKVRRRFFEVVDNFLKANEDKTTLIGVHCTHGINRTGYLVCRYMIDRLKLDPEESIKAFNTARGYEIERQNYLDDLRKSKVTALTGSTQEEETPGEDVAESCTFDLQGDGYENKTTRDDAAEFARHARRNSRDAYPPDDRSSWKGQWRRHDDTNRQRGGQLRSPAMFGRERREPVAHHPYRGPTRGNYHSGYNHPNEYYDNQNPEAAEYYHNYYHNDYLDYDRGAPFNNYGPPPPFNHNMASRYNNNWNVANNPNRYN